MTFSTFSSPGVSLQGGSGGGTPGGSTTQIQYNNAGAFAGASGLTTNGTNLTLGSASQLLWSTDLILARDDANKLALRNGTAPQTFNVYNTYTNASNYERAEHVWNTNTYVINLANAGTGSARSSFRIVGGSSGDLQVTAATNNNTAVNFRHSASVSSSGSSVGYVGRLNSHFGFFDASGAVQLVVPSGATDRVAFFGTTSSFPALKRSTTILQTRLADDSAFATIQGKLRADVNAVAETPTATHTITITDAAGTAYKVLCVAA